MSQMSSLPSRFDTNAMVSPSGEADGCELSDGSCVSWIASELVIGCMKIWRCAVRGEWNSTARPSAGNDGAPSAPGAVVRGGGVVASAALTQISGWPSRGDTNARGG